MFDVDKDYRIIQPLAQFYASELINTEWIEPGKKINTIFPSSSAVPDGAGGDMVTSYAVLRPDKQWAVMPVNRDQEVAHAVRIAFVKDANGKPLSFQGKVDTFAFGEPQYQWHPLLVSPIAHPESAGAPVIESGVGRADPDGPPKHEQIEATFGTMFEVPAASIMVVRGNIAAQ